MSERYVGDIWDQEEGNNPKAVWLLVLKEEGYGSEPGFLSKLDPVG